MARPKRPSLRRQHFTVDGRPKKPLNPSAARRLREEGWTTYLCPMCGCTHASGPASLSDSSSPDGEGQ